MTLAVKVALNLNTTNQSSEMDNSTTAIICGNGEWGDWINMDSQKLTIMVDHTMRKGGLMDLQKWIY